MNDYAKPLPRGDAYHSEFYDYCKRHELRFQRCANCHRWRHMPRECCPECGSFDWTWERSSGKGTLFTWTVVHRASHPGFADEVPYAVVIVELEEGVRLVSRVTGLPIDDLQIGMALEVGFDDVTADTTLHRFQPVRT